MHLEHFLDYEMKKDTMDVKINLECGSPLKKEDSDYENFKVINVNYKDKIAYIKVKRFAFKVYI